MYTDYIFTPESVLVTRARQRFGVAGGVGELEGRAEIELQTKDNDEMGADDMRVLSSFRITPGHMRPI